MIKKTPKQGNFIIVAVLVYSGFIVAQSVYAQQTSSVNLTVLNDKWADVAITPDIVTIGGIDQPVAIEGKTVKLNITSSMLNGIDSDSPIYVSMDLDVVTNYPCTLFCPGTVNLYYIVDEGPPVVSELITPPMVVGLTYRGTDIHGNTLKVTTATGGFNLRVEDDIQDAWLTMSLTREWTNADDAGDYKAEVIFTFTFDI